MKAFWLFSILSFTTLAANLTDESSIALLPAGAYLKLLIDLEIDAGDYAIRFVNGHIWRYSSTPLDQTTVCLLTCRKNSTSVRRIPKDIDDGTAGLILKSGLNTRIVAVDGKVIDGTNFNLSNSRNFDSFQCYNKPERLVTLGELKTAIAGLLELVIPQPSIIESRERFKIIDNQVVDNEAQIMSPYQPTPSQCCQIF